VVIVAGWLRRFGGRASRVRTLRGPAAGAAPAWLPGNLEVAFDVPAAFRPAVRAARAQARRGVGLAAILNPTPARPADVEVYLQGGLVGRLPTRVALALHPALDAYRAAHQNRLVACPAMLDDTRPALLRLCLDHEPLGLPRRLPSQAAPEPAWSWPSMP
jgi:hypothetical protein